MRFSQLLFSIALAVVLLTTDAKSRRNTVTHAEVEVPVLVQVRGQPGLVTETQFQILERIFVDSYNLLAQDLCDTGAQVQLSSVVIERDVSEYVPPGSGTATRIFSLQYRAFTKAGKGLFYPQNRAVTNDNIIPKKRRSLKSRKAGKRGSHSKSESSSTKSGSSSSKSGSSSSKSEKSSSKSGSSSSKSGSSSSKSGSSSSKSGSSSSKSGSSSGKSGSSDSSTNPVNDEPDHDEKEDDSSRAGVDCVGLTEVAFRNAYSASVQAREDLESSVDDVLDVAEMEQVECADQTNEFLPDVIVSFMGDASLATSEQLDALAQSFGQTYNSLNALNPESCDTLFREVVSVSLVSDDGFNRRLEEDRRRSLQKGLSRRFSYLFRTKASCRQCSPTTRLFNDVQGRRELRLHSEHAITSFPFVEKRHLNEADACVCPVTAIDFDPPSEGEFLAGYITTIDILKEEGVIEEAFIESVVAVKEVDQVDECGDPETFVTAVYVDLFGTPTDVNNYELESLATSFVDTYNALADKFCDHFFRSVNEVTIDTTPDSARMLQLGSRARKFRYLYTVSSTCRQCGSNARLFNDVAGRMLAALAGESTRGHRFEEENLCFCSPDAVDKRAPTEDEFTVAYNETVKALRLEHILYVVDVVEKVDTTGSTRDGGDCTGDGNGGTGKKSGKVVKEKKSKKGGHDAKGKKSKGGTGKSGSEGGKGGTGKSGKNGEEGDKVEKGKNGKKVSEEGGKSEKGNKSQARGEKGGKGEKGKKAKSGGSHR